MCGPGFYLAHTHNQCQVEPDYKALVVKKVFQHTDIGFLYQMYGLTVESVRPWKCKNSRNRVIWFDLLQ